MEKKKKKRMLTWPSIMQNGSEPCEFCFTSCTFPVWHTRLRVRTVFCVVVQVWMHPLGSVHLYFLSSDRSHRTGPPSSHCWAEQSPAGLTMAGTFSSNSLLHLFSFSKKEQSPGIFCCLTKKTKPVREVPEESHASWLFTLWPFIF